MKTVSACVVIVVLVLVGVAQTSVGTSVARSIGLASSSERFTELYFNQEKAVAAATEGLDTRTVKAEISFVIANHESKQMTYHWTVTSDGTSRARGQLTLPAGVEKTVTPGAIATGCRLSPSKVTKAITKIVKTKKGKTRKVHTTTTVAATPHTVGAVRSQIAVSLSEPKDAINYWVTCRA